MDKYRLSEAVGEISDEFLLDAERAIARARQRPRRRGKGAVLALAAVLLLVSAAAASGGGGTFAAWIKGAFDRNIGAEDSPSTAVLEEELEEGQWVYLDGDQIAVILPESPVKILLSGDGGETWRRAVVEGSDTWDLFGTWSDQTQYWGGYLGFNGAENGYLVLTSGVAMNHQDLRIYLTGDGGETWREIGTPYGVHISVLTGAGFASDQVGFISYRYYEDAGPDIWWTRDGGETWEKLAVELPAAYRSPDCRFTPGSPVFHGEEGVYPIVVTTEDEGLEPVLYLETHDGGLTWTAQA